MTFDDCTILLIARTKSSRLPNKAVLPVFKDYPYNAINWNAKRARYTGIKTVLATSIHSSDDVLEDAAKNLDVSYYRGSLRNKIERIYGAALDSGSKYFILYDNDDLFTSIELFHSIFSYLKISDADGIKSPSSIITGCFTYAFTINALKEIYDYSCEYSEIEMMESVLPELNLNILEFPFPEMYLNKKLRFTMDYEEDLNFFKEVEKVADKGGFYDFSFKTSTYSIIDQIKDKDNLSKINFFRERDWKNNQEKIIAKESFI